jgi:hypothetical protein
MVRKRTIKEREEYLSFEEEIFRNVSDFSSDKHTRIASRKLDLKNLILAGTCWQFAD